MIARAVAALVLLTACGGGSTATTAPGTTDAGSTTTGPVGLPGFPTGTIRLGGTEWEVAVADTPELRARGLMGVTDLGGLEGMLFVFAADTTSGFWMKDTLIPLDIAFFDATGDQVGDIITMPPCEAEPCPTYAPDAPYRYALETTVGSFEGVELRLDLAP